MTKAELQAYIDRLHEQLDEARNEKGRPPTYRGMREQIRSLTAANESVRLIADSAEMEVARLRYRISQLKDELDEARNASGIRKPPHLTDTELNIEPDMLARLIRLSHPDRHGNSPSSNEATAWLLAQRQAR